MKKLVLVLIAAVGLTISSAQSNLTISGTVFARAGSSLQGLFVVACQIANDSCDEANTKAVQVQGSGSSVKYSVAGLAAKDYLMLAWRDLNNSQEVDSGDELGVYQKNGKPSEVVPPAQNIDLKLVLFTGDFDALLDQADQPQAPALTSSGLAFSGMVKPLAGSSLNGAVIFAAVYENGKYVQARSKAGNIDAAGRFSLGGLEKIPYVLIAWRDLDKDSDLSAADEVAPFRVNNQLALATPPLANISLQLEKGDSSFDALIRLTLPVVNKPVAPTAPVASSTGAVTALSCITNIYWECKIPVVPTANCPVTKLPALNAEVGFYKGYVYGFCGRPLTNYKVILYSTVSRGQVKTTFTDAKGFYRFDVKGVLGSYVGINAEGAFAGKTYSYYFDAIDEVIGADGAVQNFNFDTRKSEIRFVTYGFDRYPSIPDNYTLEMRLEPVALVDGSKGEAQTFSVPMQKSVTEFRLKGLKLGTYKMTLEIVTATGRFWTFLDVFNNSNQQKPAKTQTVTFITPDSLTVSVNLE